ncbi:MAG: phosphonate C-P lyase system protein PhnG [Rhodobacter sp.]|nr:phosphonate C-P lyase system protein PhnG [Paracoccaceae bacterium]MCC0075701.1 phosphonate C-P lyase system protein PhnG [Rhodobacter sp.]
MSNLSSFSRAQSLGLLARAPAERLAALFPEAAAHTVLRGPETGAVMVRGRQGGTGAPFNLGEMTVTRCSVRLACGTDGHAYVQGRDKAHARRAAVLDALLQTAEAARLTAGVLAPLAAEETARRATRAAKAAATKVEFFTLVRGED